jgi:hypothetical protein
MYRRVALGGEHAGAFVSMFGRRNYDFTRGDAIGLFRKDPNTGDKVPFRVLNFARTRPLPSTGSDYLDAMIAP